MHNFLSRAGVCAAAALFLFALQAAAQCPPKTTVADTIYNADGTLASGRVTISWQTFQIGSCAVVAGRATVTVTNGALSVQLYPNDAAVPGGTSYRVSYALKSGLVTTEYWVVPTSTPPVTLSAVRSATVPVPNVMFAQSQVTSLASDLAKKIEIPSPCVAGTFLQRNSSSSQPQVDCVDPPSGGGGGSGSQHQVNGVNLSANDPVNVQNSATVTFSNPSAGNIQADVANSSISAVKLSVANPSAAQLSGVGDNNVAATSLSPNRITGTAVVQLRAVATSAPLSGGGDLSADRTLSCPTCEVTSNKNGANGYAGLNASARVGIAQGGVDISTYTLGDLLYASATNVLSRLAGNITTTRKFLRQTGDGTNSAAPAWDTLQSADVPNNAANTSGNAATATALAANGTNCAAGEAARGVDAGGNAEGCFTPSGGGGSNHNLLSATHTDTSTASVARGAGIFGIGSTPAWTLVQLNSTDRYFKRSSSGDIVESSAAGTGPGSCTNQFVRATNADAAPTCASVVKADLPATVVHTDQSNTYSTGTQDFGSATAVKVPTSAGSAEGHVWVDTSQDTFKGYDAINGAAAFTRVAPCAPQRSTTDTLSDTTTSQQTFSTTCSIPANFFVAGKVLRVHIGGSFTTTSSAPNVTYSMRLGGTAIFTSQTVAFPNSTTAGIGFMFLMQGTAAPGASIAVITSMVGAAHGGSQGFERNTLAASQNVATNGALTLDWRITFSTSNGGDSFTLNQLVVEVLN